MSKKRSIFLKQCKVCDKDVAWNVKKCPHCGIKNPTVTLKQQLATWAVLLLVIGLWLTPDEKKITESRVIEQNAVETSSTKPHDTPVQTDVEKIEAPLDIEKIRSEYATYQEKRVAAEELWDTVEKYLTLYETNPSMSLSEELTKYMQLAEQAAQGSLFQEVPTGSKETTDAFKEMNSGLSGMFSNAAKRVKYALEISLGSKDPSKSMEKYARSKEMYQYNVQEFDQGALKLQQILTSMEAEPAIINDLTTEPQNLPD